MKVRIEFPDDIAKLKAEEAKAWTPGQSLVWEAEEYNVPEKIKRIKEDIVIETKHTKVILHKDEIQKIINLFK
ncbi:hypothetical protein KY342_02785 [Candidatus Woesearchaeota archaeon]|nr:hypothetical protein [Candidatus Woesearchaeota archaeon]